MEQAENPIFALEGHTEPVEILQNGLGKSDGRGTYRFYKDLGKQGELRFGRRSGTSV